MRIVATIVERDALRPVLAVSDPGGWLCYEVGDPLPAFYAPPTAQELAAQEAERTKLRTDTEAARQYTKLRNITQMSPAEVQTWVAANVNTIADVKDALTTLAIYVSVAGRPLVGGAAPRSMPPELTSKAPTLWQKTVASTKSLFTPKGKK